MTTEQEVVGPLLDPADIRANWVVTCVFLDQGSPSMGIGAPKSRFKIMEHQGANILRKIQDVEWYAWEANGNPNDIPLATVGENSQPITNPPFALMGEIGIQGEKHLLLLGSKDGGTTLHISVEPGQIAANPGGSASAGRGG
jgi:hypothetical protein